MRRLVPLVCASALLAGCMHGSTHPNAAPSFGSIVVGTGVVMIAGGTGMVLYDQAVEVSPPEDLIDLDGVVTGVGILSIALGATLIVVAKM